MENAILITNPTQTTHIQPQHTRIYFGHEFCQKRLPTPQNLSQMLAFSKQNKLDFSLITPYVTNAGLAKIATLLDVLQAAPRHHFEIVINDWGVLELIQEKNIRATLVLGRLLVKQHRDPRLASLFNGAWAKEHTTLDRQKQKIVDIIRHHYRAININGSAIQLFLQAQGFERLELDNTFHGFQLKLGAANLHASCYVPYGYISSTRKCFPNPRAEPQPHFCYITHCNQECDQYSTVIKKSNEEKLIYKRGNTIFFKNEAVSLSELAAKGIDRLVFQPTVPV